jgi:non-ribosomal peptide synthetase component F
MFVNTLAMKNKPKGEMTFSAFLREVKKKTVNAFENQDFQFEDLVERVLVNRDTSRNPLFDVMFELANIDQRPGEWSQSQVKQQEEKGYPYGYENQPTKFDITLAGTHAGERLFFTFIYNVKLFKVETMERFVEYFKRIIALVQENSEVKLKEINVVDDLFDGKLDMPQVDFGF